MTGCAEREVQRQMRKQAGKNRFTAIIAIVFRAEDELNGL